MLTGGSAWYNFLLLVKFDLTSLFELNIEEKYFVVLSMGDLIQNVFNFHRYPKYNPSPPTP